jgi:hypothetical protein
MKDWIGAALASAALVVMFGPIYFARHVTRKQHRQQFLATGSAEFELPSARAIEREDPVARPESGESGSAPSGLQAGFDEASAPTTPLAILSTETGEMVRLGTDGLPLSPADLSARTPSTSLTVDPERLAEVLQMESTGEYSYSPATWIESDAAVQFMKDPLSSPLLPPIPLVEEAGNPFLVETFRAVLAGGGLKHDWDEEDSRFHFWDREPALAGL